MTGTKYFKYALLALVPLIGIIVIREVPVFYANADYYYYKRVFFDFLELGSTWDEMYFGPAPGFFTNMLPLAIIDLFVKDLPRQFLFHICLYGMITMALIGHLSRSVTHENLSALLAVAMAILLIIVVGGDNSFWNRPSHHYGSVINLLLAMVLMVPAKGSHIATGCLFLVVILTVISDFLYIPMYLAMTGGVMLVYWLTGTATFRQAFLRGIFFVIPLAIGILLHYLITPNVVSNPVWASGMSLRAILSSPGLHLEAFKFLFVEGSRLPVYWISILTGLVALWSLRKEKTTDARYFLYYFVAMQCVIWSNIYMSGLGDTEVTRYRLFAVNYSCIVIAISSAILASHCGNKRAWHWAMLGITFLLGFGYLLWPDEKSVNYQVNQDERYIKLVRQVECVRNVVQRYDLSAGISAYKQANPFTILSGGEVFLYPVRGNNVRPYHWLVSRAGLKQKFDYAVVSKGVDESYYNYSRDYYKLGPSIVETAYGAPVISVVCDNFEVMVYPQIKFGKAED